VIAHDPLLGPGRALISVGPGRWSGQSGKELVLAEPFLHPETERRATDVSRFGSGVWLERRSLAWLQVPCAEQWLTVGASQLIPPLLPPCSRNQIESRRNSLGRVANRRRSGFSSGVLASITTTISTFLLRQCPLSCTTWLPPRGEAAERARKRLHTLTCYPPSCRNGGATQIGSKRTFQVKLIDGLTSSRMLTTFAVHA
jgi:hypothetical protein